MREIDDLLPQVMPHAPSCPEPLAIRYLREAAIELATKAKCWKERDSFPASAPDYEVLIPYEDARVLEIENARFNGIKLEPIDATELDDKLPNWDDPTAEEATPRYVTQLQPGTIRLAPRMAGTLSLRLILVPSLKATQLPDFMIDEHGIEIGKGALGRMLLHPKGDWTNPQLGAMHLAEFQTILARAHRKALKGQQNAPIRTKASFV
jgi:hypothetical protein